MNGKKLGALLALCFGCTDATATNGSLAESSPLGADASAKKLSDLSLEEKKALCDWTANVLGGYGSGVVCDSGDFLANKEDQNACLAEFPVGCDATVSEWEACRKEEAKNPCTPASTERCESLSRCTPNTKKE